MLDTDAIQTKLRSMRGRPNHEIIRRAARFFEDVPKKRPPDDWLEKGLTLLYGPVQAWVINERRSQRLPIIKLRLTTDDALDNLALIYMEEFAGS